MLFNVVEAKIKAPLGGASHIDVVNMWTCYEINPFISLC